MMILLLCGAGLLAGVMNALAGGGSFVTLSALVFAGVPSVTANASSSVALYPAGAASSWVYRDRLVPIGGLSIRSTFAVTVVGGLAGSLLLLWTPTRLFDHIVPWLLLVATVMLWFGRRLGPALRRRFRAGRATILCLQFLLGIYAGYFGGAVGLMMLAIWSMLGEGEIATLNPIRALMTTAGNSIAILCFILAGAVQWRETAIVAVGAIVGGYGGAHVGRRLDPMVARGVTLALATGITIAFFIRAFA
jgi:uncharacterized membrane protein YfcA